MRQALTHERLAGGIEPHSLAMLTGLPEIGLGQMEQRPRVCGRDIRGGHEMEARTNEIPRIERERTGIVVIAGSIGRRSESCLQQRGEALSLQPFVVEISPDLELEVAEQMAIGRRLGVARQIRQLIPGPDEVALAHEVLNDPA